jgi:hypothetical protein
MKARSCRQSCVVVDHLIGRGTCNGRGDNPSLLFRRYRSHGPNDELSHRQCRSSRTNRHPQAADSVRVDGRSQLRLGCGNLLVPL